MFKMTQMRGPEMDLSCEVKRKASDEGAQRLEAHEPRQVLALCSCAQNGADVRVLFGPCTEEARRPPQVTQDFTPLERDPGPVLARLWEGAVQARVHESILTTQLLVVGAVGKIMERPEPND